MPKVGIFGHQKNGQNEPGLMALLKKHSVVMREAEELRTLFLVSKIIERDLFGDNGALSWWSRGAAMSASIEMLEAYGAINREIRRLTA